jgi:hypothetical protein
MYVQHSRWLIKREAAISMAQLAKEGKVYALLNFLRRQYVGKDDTTPGVKDFCKVSYEGKTAYQWMKQFESKVGGSGNSEDWEYEEVIKEIETLVVISYIVLVYGIIYWSISNLSFSVFTGHD